MGAGTTRVACAANMVTADVAANLRRIEDMASDAAARGAKLVLYPETALTGLINTDNPAHDLPLGQTIPGPLTSRLAALARDLGLYLGLGLFEREGERLYDSAVLLGPEGDLALRHRRIHPGWTGPNADRDVYALGDDVPLALTALGSFAFLICGDMWDDSVVARCREHRPDYILYPFARCFPDGAWDQERWDREERAEYVRRAASTGATVLMVNYLAAPELEGGAFGGAMIVSPAGELIAELPLGREGLLVAEV